MTRSGRSQSERRLLQQGQPGREQLRRRGSKRQPHSTGYHQGLQRGYLAMAAMQTLWPAFIGAALCVGVVFSLFNPAQTDGLPDFFPTSAEGIYTATFLLLWLANTVGCLATWYLAGGRESRNRGDA